jgi:hypothetical protein
MTHASGDIGMYASDGCIQAGAFAVHLIVVSVCVGGGVTTHPHPPSLSLSGRSHGVGGQLEELRLGTVLEKKERKDRLTLFIVQ